MYKYSIWSFMCMHIYIYIVYIRIYIVYIHIYIYICIYIYIHIYCIYIYTLYIYNYMYIYTVYIYIYMHVYCFLFFWNPTIQSCSLSRLPVFRFTLLHLDLAIIFGLEKRFIGVGLVWDWWCIGMGQVTKSTPVVYIKIAGIDGYLWILIPKQNCIYI